MLALPENSPRLTEITSWLRNQVAVDEATAEIGALDDIPDTRTTFRRTIETIVTIVTGLWVFDLYWRLKDGPRVPVATQFLQWIETMKPSDELWRYDTGGDSWDNLVGECGFAVLRDGKVVDFWVHLEN